MGTILSYAFMGFALLMSIAILSDFKDYKQCLFLFAGVAILAVLPWYYLNWPIPYALAGASFAVMMFNPFKPKEGTHAAQFEAECKAENEKYAKEHPIIGGSSDLKMAEMASWVKHFGVNDEYGITQSRIKTELDIQSGRAENGTNGVWLKD